MVVHNRNLKHLCLLSHWAVVSKEFMEAVSAHGGLRARYLNSVQNYI